MIPYSGPKLTDLHTLSQSNLKAIPFTVAHTYIAHIWQYALPQAKIYLCLRGRQWEGDT